MMMLRRTIIASHREAAARGAVLLTVWLLSVMMVTWFVLDPVKDAVLAAFLGTGRRLDMLTVLGALQDALTAPRLALLSLAGLLTLALAASEVRSRSVTAMLRDGGWPLLLGLGSLLVFFGHSYLGRGLLLSGDTAAHMSMVMTRRAAILADAYPDWSNFKRFGLPLHAFYSPTTFVPLARLATVLQPEVALRLFLFACHLASGLAAFAMLRDMGLGRLAAGFGALIYAGSFAHLHALLFRGNLPLALSFVLLPLAFLFLHRSLVRPPAPGNLAGLVLVAAGLLANYTPFAIVAALYLSLFALAFMIAGSAPWSRLGVLASAGVLAGALAGLVLLPAIMAESEIKPLDLAALIYLEWPSRAYVQHLLVWRAWRTDMPGAAAYLGVSAVLLAVAGAAHAVRNSANGTRLILRYVLVALVVSLVLRGMHVRDIAFTLFFLSVLAGAGAAALCLARPALRHFPAVLLAVVVVDLGSTAIQPIGRSDKAFQTQAGAFLAAQSPPTRFIEGQVVDGQYRFDSGAGILTWFAAESVGGGHVEMATPAWVHGDLAGLLVEADLRETGRLRPPTRALLCLLRVGRIIAISPVALGLPESVLDAEPEGPLGRVLSPRCRYAVVASNQLVPADLPPIDIRVDYGETHLPARLPAYRAFLDALLQRMMIDAESGIAARIPVPGLTATIEAAAGHAPVIAVEDYGVAASRIRLVVTASAPAFLRLSHAWHPSLQVRLNGTSVQTWRDAMGMIVLRASSGRNDIDIVPGTVPGRAAGWAVSLAALVLLIGGVLVWMCFRLAQARRENIPQRDPARGLPERHEHGA